MNLFTKIDNLKDNELLQVQPALDWLKNFITKPNPLLNREGEVCPCAVHSIQKKQIYFAQLDLSDCDGYDKRQILTNKVINFAEDVVSSQVHEVMNSYVIVVRGVEKHEYKYILDGSYTDAKMIILQKRLMVGYFHLYNNRTSRLNNTFFPMRPEMPIIAMREMTKSDIGSLSENEDYISIYNNFFK